MEEISKRRKPDNCLVWAILSTLFCCLPFGIVSIVYASKVDSEWALGNFDEAEDAAKKARTWAIVSAAVCLFIRAYLYRYYRIGSCSGAFFGFIYFCGIGFCGCCRRASVCSLSGGSITGSILNVACGCLSAFSIG